MKKAPWTTREIKALHDGYTAGVPIAAIGRQLGRSKFAVGDKAHRMQLKHSSKENDTVNGKQKPVHAVTLQNPRQYQSWIDEATTGLQNGFMGCVPKNTYNSMEADLNADADADLPKHGEGDQEEVERTHWTPDQQEALADGIKRGSSVDEIAKIVGKSIPDTYATIREKRLGKRYNAHT